MLSIYDTFIPRLNPDSTFAWLPANTRDKVIISTSALTVTENRGVEKVRPADTILCSTSKP